MTYAEYLELERTSEVKHEFIGGEVHQMAGGTPEHGRLTAAASGLLFAALQGKPCVVLSSDVRVKIAETGRATYPDVTVVCGPLEPASDDPDAVVNPALIVEVLSPATEASDRGDKFAHYRRLASLKEYVLVAQGRAHVEVFRREGDLWTLREHGPGGRIELESVGVELEVDALYANPVAG